MSSSLLRVALVLVTPLAFLTRVHGQTPASDATATPPAAATAPAAEPQDTAEAKLAVVLRSYSLLEAENDQLKAAQEKLLTEKSSLEAQLAVAKNALPLADQAAALHEQLRQTQDQLAALSLENNALKTRLATGSSSASMTVSSTLQPSAVTSAAVAANAARRGRWDACVIVGISLFRFIVIACQPWRSIPWRTPRGFSGTHPSPRGSVV